MREGTVKFFNQKNGFGFIIDNETKEEYYVKTSGLLNPVKDNDAVTFELSEGRKGLNAVNVKTA